MTVALHDTLLHEASTGTASSTRVTLRRIALAGLVLAVVAVVVAVAWFGISALRTATQIDVVRVEGVFRPTTQTDIERSMAALVAGRSLVDVPMDDIARELTALSWVESVDVYRVWPHSLVVHVSEKVPVARWNDDGFISHAGVVFQPESIAAVGDLPMLAGPADKATQVMAFYSGVNAMLLPLGLSVRELKLNTSLSWEIVLGNGISIRVDQQDSQARIRRFLQAYEKNLHQFADSISTVDLRYIGGFSVGWKNTGEAHGSKH